MGTEVAQQTGLLDVRTGEVLPANVDNAARVLHSGRALKAQINDVQREATEWLAQESARRGTKTLHGEQETITLTGGTGIDYDPVDLREALELAGCPQDRIEAAIVTTVTYKVDRRVLRELRAANKDYAAAIELAEIEVDTPVRASVKLRQKP